MAAPVKNLVDASAPSKAAFACEFHPIFKRIFNPINPNKFTSISMLQIYTTTLPVRWQLVEVCKVFVSKTIQNRVKVKLSEAGVAAIKTFPAIYREKTSTRKTEGQIFPSGMN